MKIKGTICSELRQIAGKCIGTLISIIFFVVRIVIFFKLSHLDVIDNYFTF